MYPFDTSIGLYSEKYMRTNGLSIVVMLALKEYGIIQEAANHGLHLQLSILDGWPWPWLIDLGRVSYIIVSVLSTWHSDTYLNGGDMTGHGETLSWRLPCRTSVSSVQPNVRLSKTNERDVNVKPSTLNSPWTCELFLEQKWGHGSVVTT